MRRQICVYMLLCDFSKKKQREQRYEGGISKKYVETKVSINPGIFGVEDFCKQSWK